MNGTLVEEEFLGWLHTLSTARRFLSHSYVLAFYLFGDTFRNEMSEVKRETWKNLYEYHQRQLAGHLERLSGLLTSEVSIDDPNSKRISIIDQSIITDSLCRNLYNFIKNDLFGSLKSGPLQIAPYRPGGPLRAILKGSITTDDSC
ncbi:hypothetical protein CDL15_Pgr004212 [Punica granatum]|nr:hypothetical protein CDL15_Pgr004212 [Punica granatum]